MQRWAVLTIAAACAKPAAAPPVSTPAPAPPAAPTCAEIGIILRGDVDEGGPAREQAIQTACERDRWAAEVIRCAASEVPAATCLDRLTAEQRKAYDAIIAPPPAANDDPGLSCADALHNADVMRPVLDDTSPERAWQSEHRRHHLVSECERQGWKPVARACLAIATTPDAFDACLVSELDPTALDVLRKRLEDVARDAKAIATLRKTPSKIDCKRVGDSGRCKAEGWDEFRRACTIVGRSDCAVGSSSQR